MLLRPLLIAGTIFFNGSLSAQSNTVTTGGNASGTTGSVSYTVGQVDYISASASNGNLNQGVQQPYEFYAVSGLEEYNELVNLSMGPNPTSDVLYITTHAETSEDLHYMLTDDLGKLIISKSILEPSNELNLSDLPSAIYQLVIISGEKEIKTYKIIKH